MDSGADTKRPGRDQDDWRVGREGRAVRWQGRDSVLFIQYNHMSQLFTLDSHLHRPASGKAKNVGASNKSTNGSRVITLKLGRSHSPVDRGTACPDTRLIV